MNERTIIAIVTFIPFFVFAIGIKIWMRKGGVARLTAKFRKDNTLKK